MYNSVTLVGHLTKDPEMKYSVDGTAITKFSIAVNGYKKEDVDFFNIVTFKKLAEVCDNFLKKGKLILIEGAIKNSSPSSSASTQT